MASLGVAVPHLGLRSAQAEPGSAGPSLAEPGRAVARSTTPMMPARRRGAKGASKFKETHRRHLAAPAGGCGVCDTCCPLAAARRTAPRRAPPTLLVSALALEIRPSAHFVKDTGNSTAIFMAHVGVGGRKP